MLVFKLLNDVSDFNWKDGGILDRDFSLSAAIVSPPL